MALNIDAFTAVSSGSHNEGFVDINANGELAIHNNHVWRTDKNDYVADEEKNAAVRNAFLNALSGELHISEKCRELLVGRLVSDPKVVCTPLTRREIKEMIELARQDAAYTGVRAEGHAAETDAALDALGNMVGQHLVVQGVKATLKSTINLDALPDAIRADLVNHAKKVDRQIQQTYRLTAQDFAHDKAGCEAQIRDTIKAYADYENDLRRLYRGIKEDGPVCDVLAEMIDNCAARVAEIETAARQLEAQPIAPKANIVQMMGLNAAVMHGNDEVTQILSGEVTALRQQLDQLRQANPDDEATEDQLDTLAANIRAMRDRLADIKANGIVYGGDVKKDRVIPEKSFLKGLEEAVLRMLGDLNALRHPSFARELRRIFASLPDELAGVRGHFQASIRKDGTIDQTRYNAAMAKLQDIVMSEEGFYSIKTRNFAYLASKLIKEIVAEMKRIRDMGGHPELKPGVLEKLVSGTLSEGTLVACYAYGLSSDLVDETLDDRYFAAEPHALGSGMNNTAWILKYRQSDGTLKTRIFKEEMNACVGLRNLLLGKTGYEMKNRVIEINIASGRAAANLGVPKVMVQSTAGVFNGKIGLFMEQARGEDGTHKVRIPRANRSRALGSLMKGSCDLAWVDWLTGQGDRHMKNLLVGEEPDGRLRMTGIDNDASFAATRIGRTRFILNGQQLNKLAEELNETNPALINAAHPGALEIVDGKWVLDLRVQGSEELDPELARVIKNVNGLNSCPLPRRISREVYTNLMAIADDQEARERFISSMLGPHFSNAQAEAIRMRLQEMIAYARHLKTLDDAHPGHYILTQEQWESDAIVDELLNERRDHERAIAHVDNDASYLMRGYFDKLGIVLV